MSLQPSTKVGIGLFIVRDGKVLLGKRKSKHGKGEYGGPGGHLEYMESFEDCALRELREEAGPDIIITRLDFLCVTNLMAYAPKHYVDIGMVAEWVSGNPTVMEPDKIENWEWYPIDALPTPRFGCLNNYLTAYTSKKRYFCRAS
jgi:8-oxo-dGTP diphosphatase